MARKVDVLLSSGGGGGVDITASPGTVPSSLTGDDLAQIKAMESNILHQLGDLRWVGGCFSWTHLGPILSSFSERLFSFGGYFV